MPFVNTQVHFEQYDPRDEKGTDVRRSLADLDYSPLPRVTMRSFVMGCLISMGGLVFGYDTGQISGFLEMPNFLMRFGQQHADGTYYFSNVRSGLIVALVRVSISNAYNRILTTSSYQLVHLSALLLLLQWPTRSVAGSRSLSGPLLYPLVSSFRSLRTLPGIKL